ncbi:hypothetical protein BD309DRAFT_361855 [Dichomitus squalens]|nr:hypothetical protein BD309DRAFT_361855 [Dichomitus squalens]
MATSTTQLDTETFLQEFLPSSPYNHHERHPHHNPFSTLQKADRMPENELSDLFVCHGLVPGSKASHYRRSATPLLQEKLADTSAAVFRSQDVPDAAHPRGLDQTVSIQFRSRRKGIDPFDFHCEDRHHGISERARRRLFDRISTVADFAFAAQHRVFLFMLLVIGRRFRLLRWDRAGVIVTPSIDYYEHPDTLCEVLLRVSHQGENALGLDPSAIRLQPTDVDFLRMDVASLKTPADLSHAERKLQESETEGPLVFEYVRSLFRTSLHGDWPRHRLEVPDGPNIREFLVGKPVFCASDIVGRGYVALDCKTGRFVWLKDVWRASYVITETEGDVLRRLNDAGIQNVPTLVCHGDIREQATITADFWERQQNLPSAVQQPLSPPSTATSSHSFPASSAGSRKRKSVEEPVFTPELLQNANAITKSHCPLRQHKHYRVAVEEVCMPLKHFQYGRQLLSIVLDCLRAHQQAATYPGPKLLHRDISGGNILIYPRVRRDKNGQNPVMAWTGILSDWELSKPIDVQEPASRATQAERMGTFQFMSVNLLRHVTKPIQISDELESFLHVLVYYAVRYLHSNCKHVESWVNAYFHEYVGPGRDLCCGQKSYTIEVTGQLRTWILEGPLVFRSPIDFVLSTILKSLRAHYKVMDYEALQAAPPEPPCREPIRSLTSAELHPTMPLVPLRDPEEHPDIAEWEADWEAGEKVIDERPTPEDRALAAKVADHKFMLELISRQLLNPCWRTDERIPSTQTSTGNTLTNNVSPSLEPTPRAASASNKRQRTSGPERNVSLPARLHTSARRARSQARTLPVGRRAKQ